MTMKKDAGDNARPAGNAYMRELAQKHGVTEGAVAELYSALQRGGGSMAQFNHPDLGGNGQWMANGMTMIGDMFNDGLKAKVCGLCEALLPHVPGGLPGARRSASEQGPEMRAGAHVARAWWPTEYGSAPAASGGQNDFRYAYFPRENALVVEQNGQTAVYDTTGHEFHGFGQQQRSSSGFTVRSAHGEVELSQLPRRA